jgi:UV DNA damage endonuclease
MVVAFLRSLCLLFTTAQLCYNAEDLLPLCEELDVPLVFGMSERYSRDSINRSLDYHHDILNPSSFPPKTIIERANAIWARRGIRPKQHLSEPRPGAVTLMERRAHADRCESLPADLPDDMGMSFSSITTSQVFNIDFHV